MTLAELVVYVKAHHRKARSRCFFCDQSWPCDAYLLAESVSDHGL